MIPQTAISSMDLIEPTYNASQIMALNQAWWNNAYQFGVIVFAAGMIIGGVIVYLRFRYGSSE